MWSISMFYEDDGQHSKPHVHVRYGDYEASIGIFRQQYPRRKNSAQAMPLGWQYARTRFMQHGTTPRAASRSRASREGGNRARSGRHRLKRATYDAVRLRSASCGSSRRCAGGHAGALAYTLPSLCAHTLPSLYARLSATCAFVGSCIYPA